MTHVVLISGGPDSAYALKRAIDCTDQPVVALHVVRACCSGSKLHLREEEAARRVFEALCGGLDRCTYADAYSRMSPEVCGPIPDLMIVAPFVASACLLLEDVECVHVGPDPKMVDGVIDNHFALAVRTCMVPARNGIDPPAHFWPRGRENDVSKQQVREALGEVLWEATWSCRNPKGLAQCGECEGCLERKETTGA